MSSPIATIVFEGSIKIFAPAVDIPWILLALEQGKPKGKPKGKEQGEGSCWFGDKCKFKKTTCLHSHPKEGSDVRGAGAGASSSKGKAVASGGKQVVITKGQEDTAKRLSTFIKAQSEKSLSVVKFKGFYDKDEGQYDKEIIGKLGIRQFCELFPTLLHYTKGEKPHLTIVEAL